MKRIIYTLACLMLSVGAWAQNVAKIGTTEYATLADAIAAVPTDGTETTITMLTDADVTAALTIANTKSVILDLNGKTIKNEDTKSLAQLITVNGRLTIDDSSSDKSGIIKNTASAKYVLKTGTAASVVSLRNGTIQTTTGSGNGAVYGTNGSFVMTGGKIIAAGTGVTSKNVTISGGEITATAGQALCAAGTITGGKFTSSNNNAVYANQSGTLEITGGEFTGVSSKPTINIYTTDVKVSGATLNNGVGFASNATAMILAGSDDAYLTNTHAAFYDGESLIGYAPINAGLFASSKVSGKTVKLTKDVATTTYINVTKSFTLDLNGHNIACTPAKADAAILTKGTASAPVELTIKGDGKVSCADHGEGCNAVQVSNYVKLNIEGGEFSVPGDNAAIYIVSSVATNPSSVTITDGYFESGDGKWIVNCKDDAYKNGGANILIKGGSFSADPSQFLSEGVGTNFLDEAYTAVQGADGKYTVQQAFAAKIGDTKYATLAAAISAAQNGETVTLLTDVTENIVVPAGKEITLDLNGKTLSGGSVASNGKNAAIVNNGTIIIQDSSAEQTGTIKREDDDTSLSASNSYYVIDNQGTMTIKSGNVMNKAGVPGAHKGSSLIRNGEPNSAVLTIEGGTLTQDNFDVIKNGGNGTLNITGGTINSANSYAVLSYSLMNMSEGSINGKVCLRSYTDSEEDTHGVGNITGGTINGDITVETYKGNTPNSLSECNISGTAVINGTLSIGEGNGNTFTANDDKGTIAVSGGTFNNAVQEQYCAEGFKPTDDGNGHYGVTEKDYVAQIGENKYASLAEAVAAAQNGETITLLADATANAMIEISGKNITLDLNGKTVSPVDGTKINGGLIGVHNGAGLTINDSSVDKTGKITSGDSGKVYAAVQVTVKDDAATEPARLTINGGNFEGYYYAISGNGTRHNTEITINDGTFKGLANSPSTDDMGLAIFHPQEGKLTINGGEFEGPAAGVEIRAGELNISDGSFKATATEFSEKWNGSGSTVVGAAIAISQHSTNKDIKVNITGGTFDGLKAVYEVDLNPTTGDKSDNININIQDGTFNGTVASENVQNFVSGGTFKNPVPEEYCAGGYIPEDNGDGTYGVKSGSYVAQIDDTKYDSLSAAINAATAGQTVKLIADINETVENANANSVTINLNGKNWTSGSYTLKNDGGTITIEGEGTVKSTGSEGIAVWARTGSIIINSGNYENCSNGESTVYVGTTDANLAGKQPTITINGGSFKNTAEGVYKWNTSLLPLTLNIINNIAIADTYQAIVVKGGEFYGNNPSIGDDSQLNKINNNSNFVSSELHAEMKEGVDGVFVIEEGGYVAQVGYIKYLTLDEAADASSTETITLLADATIETIDVVTGKTIDKNEHEITVNTFEVIDYEACNIPFDFKANTATYTRNVANNVWGTVCVPFTLKSCDSYTLYKVDGISNDVLEVSEVTDAVVPGTPVIFKAASAAESLTFSTEQANVKLDAPVASNGLIGTYSELTITEGLPSIYFINGDKFHQAQVSLTVPAYRAYIKNTTSGAKPRVLSLFVNEPDVTAIESVSSAATATAIYDASGRKLSTPQKGLNIVKLADGKTVKLLIK